MLDRKTGRKQGGLPGRDNGWRAQEREMMRKSIPRGIEGRANASRQGGVNSFHKCWNLTIWK